MGYRLPWWGALPLAAAVLAPIAALAKSPPDPISYATPLSAPVEIRVTPGWQATCTLRQELRSDDDSDAQQIVTFDTHVEGEETAPILVQVVRGFGDSTDGPPEFGYEHRMTMNRDARPVAAEARAIRGFPISARALRDAAENGRVDIRDAIFTGRIFRQDAPINLAPEETFRFLRPVIPRGTRVAELIDQQDQTRVIGEVTINDRRTLVTTIDVTATTARRAGVTDIAMSGWLLLDQESGLISGERWTARILKTATEAFELDTEITCAVSRRPDQNR